jgi:hypothetical protein
MDYSRNVVVLTLAPGSRATPDSDPGRQPNPRFVGGGEATLVCGHCRFEIGVVVDPSRFHGETVPCPKCGRVNSLPGSATAANAPVNE